ncbi:hypothetical protein O181_109037 [Austropuccinia psidii MF-1]|uniref:Uncharacterized protein n=1 Tax=Austropuccinia psidii MF-1 TaxID=1389203 RepID=A0A9Q3JVD0_9BASI|nr:hypothetical protein [Austropuccinia psidii MF-1]
MSSKLTELTESSPSAPPPSVLHGSGILNQFSSPSMASSGHFDPTQIYEGYKEFEKPCHQTGKQASNIRRYLWSKRGGPFGKEFPVSEALTLDVTGSRQRDVARWTNVGGPIPVGGRSIYSSSGVPISRINTEGIVKRIRLISNSSPDPDAEGSDELDGEEVEVIHHSAGHPSNSSPSQPPAKRFQSQVIHSTPRNFQPTLATIPTASPHSSHTRPALNPELRPSLIQQSRNSPIVNSQQLQPVASTSRRREELSSLHFLPPKCFSAGIDGLSEL